MIVNLCEQPFIRMAPLRSFSAIFDVMVEVLSNKMTEIIALCKKHKVDAMYVFGSAAKHSMNAESDIDLLVHFSEDIDVLDYADNYFSLLDSLEVLTGKKIDLISLRSIKNPVLLEEIENSKIELYAA